MALRLALPRYWCRVLNILVIRERTRRPLFDCRRIAKCTLKWRILPPGDIFYRFRLPPMTTECGRIEKHHGRPPPTLVIRLYDRKLISVKRVYGFRAKLPKRKIEANTADKRTTTKQNRRRLIYYL